MRKEDGILIKAIFDFLSIKNLLHEATESEKSQINFFLILIKNKGNGKCIINLVNTDLMLKASCIYNSNLVLLLDQCEM